MDTKEQSDLFLPDNLQSYPELAALVRSFDSPKCDSEILYLGDSVLERISWNDHDKRTLGQMFAGIIANQKKLLYISHSAYHMEVYFYLLQVLRHTACRPEIVVLPVNMRSFSPQWDLRPSWQFKNEIDFLKQYINDPRRDIPKLEQASIEWDKSESFTGIEVAYPLTNLKSIGQFLQIINSSPATDEQSLYRKRQIFIFHYLHPLLPAHRKLGFLGEIIKLLNSMHIQLLIYITPINYQAGERYLGENFTNILSANVKIVKEYISSSTVKGNVWFLDLSESLSSDFFSYLDDASEHLNQYGRLTLALKLTNEVLLMDAEKTEGAAL